ncbi:hypothetical protein, partial [Klebsiella pneumoniae]|uniref:hypothetical protein n=1 Tax=Klebsiella pneumoniae TaxID=573 RepID=UPI001C40A575
RAYCLKTQPATGETYPKSDLFNKAHLILQKSVYYAEANGNMTTHIPRPSARITSLRHARESFKNSNFYGIVKAVGLIVLANLSPSTIKVQDKADFSFIVRR